MNEEVATLQRRQEWATILHLLECSPPSSDALTGTLYSSAAHQARRSADRAAWNPLTPCTPPPGGVEAEQR